MGRNHPLYGDCVWPSSKDVNAQCPRPVWLNTPSSTNRMPRLWISSMSSLNAASPPSSGSTFMKSEGWYRWLAVERKTGVV